MLPTKGYFQDIECPFYNTNCGRPYCHFRHKKKGQDNAEENGFPTYKPTPKSELENINSAKSHIPISYVPDLAFTRERTARPIRIEKATYQPTPISILSSAAKIDENSLSNSREDQAQIKNIQENIASNVYDPSQSEINFEGLSNEFEVIDNIINDSESKKLKNESISQNKLNLEHSNKDTSDKLNDYKTERKQQTANKEKSTHRKEDIKESSKKKHKRKERSKSPKEHRREKDHKSESRSKRSSESSKSKSHSSREKSKSSSSKKRHRSKSRSHSHSKSKHDKEKDRKNSSKNKKYEIQSEIPVDDITVPLDMEFEMESEEETLQECYKIFNEYKPEEKSLLEAKDDPPEPESAPDNIYQSKKRTAHPGAANITSNSKLSVATPKSRILPGQMLTQRYKIAKMVQANNEQAHIMNEIKTITTQQSVKRPAANLLEAARLHKIKRLEQQKVLENQKPSVNVVDDILNGVQTKPGTSKVRKIAAVPNAALIEKAKERISLVKSQKLQNVKTIAQTQKGNRVAHVPDYSLNNIPDVLQAEKSKLPVNVRTRFLTMIADECVKLYALRDDAYNRALNEEFSCYEKCKVLATYRNSSMLAVNRLRKELQERENKGLGPILSGETVRQKEQSEFEGKVFYDRVKKWLLTSEELDEHGYPKESSERGKAILTNISSEIDYSLTDDNRRKCSRCGKIYKVDDEGWPLFEQECMYHPLKKRTIRREQMYLCCKSNDETGCVTSDTHVFDGGKSHFVEGYQTTLPPESDNDHRSVQVFALDCEMCYTTKGLELTRVTIVDTHCKTVYESFVKPLNPIIDYNTRFSGITKEQMERTSTSILQVQANILHLCNSETILVGHSLESDMKALKIIHRNIIDTAILFPHKMGPPHKRALRALASEYLKKIIQNDVAGHDSAEDAVTCMELIKWKLKEDLKVKIK